MTTITCSRYSSHRLVYVTQRKPRSRDGKECTTIVFCDSHVRTGCITTWHPHVFADVPTNVTAWIVCLNIREIWYSPGHFDHTVILSYNRSAKYLLRAIETSKRCGNWLSTLIAYCNAAILKSQFCQLSLTSR